MKKYFKTNLGKIILILLFTFLSVGMISIIPLTTKYIIDSYQDLNVTKILILGGIYVLAIVLFLVFEYLKKIGNVSFQKAVCKELKEDLFNQVLSVENSYIFKNSSAYYQNLLTHDVEVIFQKYYGVVIEMISSIISFAIYFGVMLFLDWKLALAIVVVCFLSLLLPKLVGKKLKDLQEIASMEEEAFLQRLDELVSAKEAFNGETKNSLFKSFNEKNESLESSVYVLNKNYCKSDIFTASSLYVINIVAFLLGILFIYLKLTTVANFVAIIAFIESIAIPTRDIVFEIIVLKSTKKIRLKLQETLNMPVKHKEKTDFKTLEVSNLYYRYEDAEDDILKNISCVFEKGKKYAVVGKNGSGKTTFIRILSQIYSNYTGTIKLNNLDFSNYDFSSFGYYTSVESFLLNGSLKDNITILDSYSLNVENEIPKLGVSHLKDSIIDPSCSNVSSGEKSKISILRALNTKKELLIFDEIFANVDEESEQLLTQYLLSLDKTIILITHNLDDETLSKFDGIIQL